MEKAIDELDATCTEAKAAAGENDTIREERLRTLAEGGFNPVIAVGFIYSPAAAKVAAEYPDTNFAVIDGYSPRSTEDSRSTNLVDLTFAEEQGSYLVGVAAALKTKAKHVGFVGGTHGDLIKKFEAGFTAGVEVRRPDDQDRGPVPHRGPERRQDRLREPDRWQGRRDGACTTRAPTSSTTPPASRASASSTRSRPPARATGPSASTPTSTSRVDEAQKPYILTSMLKRIDTAVFDYVKAFDDGDAVGRLRRLRPEGRRRRLLHVRWLRRRHQPTRSTRQPSRSRAARSRCRRTRPRSVTDPLDGEPP